MDYITPKCWPKPHKELTIVRHVSRKDEPSGLMVLGLDHAEISTVTTLGEKLSM